MLASSNQPNIGIKNKSDDMYLYADTPLRMAVKPTLFGVHNLVCRLCESKKATKKKDRETMLWPGIAYYGADAVRVVWSNGEDTVYDGVDDGPLYSRLSLAADLESAALVVHAIRCPQVITTPADARDPELDEYLKHVYDAVHARMEQHQDWLLWFIARLAEIPTLPQLNSRQTPKKLYRGVGKAKSPKCACTRKEFVAKLCDGLSFQEVMLMWHDHIKKCH